MIENGEKDMKPILLEDLGLRFPTERSKQKTRYGKFECQWCGSNFEAIISTINAGQLSCGCQRPHTHNLTSHRLYDTYRNMLRRCYNTSNKQYDDYGGRGITVCNDWKNDIVKFIEDMFPTFEEGLTLDRIDNDKGYCKENCRWATRSEQCINQRIKSNNTSGYIGVTFNKLRGKYSTQIQHNKVIHRLGYFYTALEAAIVRNNYIIENNLPHLQNKLD